MPSFAARFLAPFACILALSATVPAQAHYLWLEGDGQNFKLYYGEAEMLLKEKSPGKLDNIKAPRAYFTSGKEQAPSAASIKRSGTHFQIEGQANVGAAIAAEESLDPRDLSKHGLGIAKSNYYARIGQTWPTPGILALDIERTGPASFVILYKGSPVSGAKVEVIAPNTWMQEHKTDATGRITINTPWRGKYVVHALHIDRTAGEFAGQRYDNLRNHLTYAFTRQEGTDPGPAIPPVDAED